MLSVFFATQHLVILHSPFKMIAASSQAVAELIAKGWHVKGELFSLFGVLRT